MLGKNIVQNGLNTASFGRMLQSSWVQQRHCVTPAARPIDRGNSAAASSRKTCRQQLSSTMHVTKDKASTSRRRPSTPPVRWDRSPNPCEHRPKPGGPGCPSGSAFPSAGRVGRAVGPWELGCLSVERRGLLIEGHRPDQGPRGWLSDRDDPGLMTEVGLRGEADDGAYQGNVVGTGEGRGAARVKGRAARRGYELGTSAVEVR